MAVRRYESGCFTATEALEAFRRVKLTPGSVTAVQYADAGEDAIGLTATAAALGDDVTVEFIDADNTMKGVAAGLIAGATVLYGANDGKLSDAVNGNPIGTLLEAATADGDVVEFLPNNGVGASVNGASCLPVADGGHGVPFVILKSFADAASGDTAIFTANAPFKFRVIDALFENRGANGANANTVQLCAAAGGVSPITDAMSTNGLTDKAVVRAASIDDAAGTIAAGGDLVIARTKAGGVLAGELRVNCIRVS